MALEVPAPYQQALVEQMTSLLLAEPRLEAAWLAGSLGRGDGDEFSDVDVLALISEGDDLAATSASLLDAVSAAYSPVLANVLFGGRVISVVTPEWHRFDVSLITPGDLGRYNANLLRPIFRRGHLEPPAREPAIYRASAETVDRLVREFFRVLGLAVVCAGRGEYVLMLDGAGLLRSMTVDLMLEENSITPDVRGGMLRRNPLLTAEQRVELEAVPPLVATRESVLAANSYLAGVFLSRARRLAAGIGLAWPDALEAATRRSLQHHLNFRLP